MTIKTYEPNSTGYKNLKMAAEMMQFLSEKNRRYIVENCMFDDGMGWEWTTIIRKGLHDKWDSQVLIPSDHERIINANSLEELFKVVTDIRAGGMR